jgi:Leucine-rich repeat (LRR) protein
MSYNMTENDQQQEEDICKENWDEIFKILALGNVNQPPQNVGPFHMITKLDLFGARLSSLPQSLSIALPNLSILFCMKNKFEVMPEVIGRCTSLSMVSFKSNELTEIHPEALAPQMRWLILTDNKLQSLPRTIGRCNKLQKLMLSGNQLTHLPEEISSCHGLELIRLSSNHLQEPPMTLLKLPKLSWIALSDNPFLASCTSVSESHLELYPQDILDDPTKGEVLGRGASGITLRCCSQRVFFYNNIRWKSSRRT